MAASLSWLERCPLAIAVVERGGTVLYWSAGAERVTGWRWDEIIGRKAGLDLFDRRSAAFGLMRQLLREGRIEGRTVALRGGDGRLRTLSLSVAPLFTQGSEVASYLAFGLEASIDTFAPSSIDAHGEGVSIVEQLQQGIVVEDATGYVTYANQAAARLFGRPVQRLLGRHWSALVPSAELQALSEQLRSRRAGRAQVYETKIARPDGHDLPVLVNARPQHKDGRFAGVMSEFSELSQVRTLERRLRRAESAGASAIVLQALAHDLSNLLAVVIPQTEMLAERAGQDGSRELAEQTRAISAALERGGWLVQQLADCRADLSDDPQALDLARELESMKLLLPQVAGCDVALDLRLGQGASPWVRMHPVECQQIVLNLVGNARDAVGEDGFIRVSLTRAEDGEHGRMAVLSVEDNGGGIEAELLPRVFEPFVSSKPSAKGSGLGLHMVRRLVERRGGRVRVHSAPGEGSRFELLIPECVPREPRSEGAAIVATDAKGPLRILVVEDEAALGTTICQALEHLGHRCELSMTASSALESLSPGEHVYDLALIDVGLPDQDGRELRRLLERRDQRLATILCSGRPISGGAGVDCLRKPFTISELSVMIQRAMTRVERGASIG